MAFQCCCLGEVFFAFLGHSGLISLHSGLKIEKTIKIKLSFSRKKSLKVFRLKAAMPKSEKDFTTTALEGHFHPKSYRLNDKMSIKKDNVQDVIPIAKRKDLMNFAILTGRQVSRPLKVARFGGRSKWPNSSSLCVWQWG